MADKEASGEAGERSPDARDRELLNADGQSARLLSNTSGEYSIDNARAAFDKAFEGEVASNSEGEETDGGTRDE